MWPDPHADNPEKGSSALSSTLWSQSSSTIQKISLTPAVHVKHTHVVCLQLPLVLQLGGFCAGLQHALHVQHKRDIHHFPES